jgi:predicted secreted Zn-dependent protease
MSIVSTCYAKSISKLWGGIQSGLVIVWCTAAGAGNPEFITSWKYYNVTGTTAKELKKDMKQNGPNGYWAYARWYINWSGNCQVDVTINYTMPRWQNRTNTPKKLQDSWDKMIANLKAHEEVHGSHGIKAANAIVASKCQSAHDIITKWANEDKNFDARTGHGRKQGVILR